MGCKIVCRLYNELYGVRILSLLTCQKALSFVYASKDPVPHRSRSYGYSTDWLVLEEAPKRRLHQSPLCAT